MYSFLTWNLEIWLKLKHLEKLRDGCVGLKNVARASIDDVNTSVLIEEVGRKGHSYFKASGTEPRTTNCWVQPRHFCRLWGGKKVSVWDKHSDTMTWCVKTHRLQVCSFKMKKKNKQKTLMELKICRVRTSAGKKGSILTSCCFLSTAMRLWYCSLLRGECGELRERASE